MAAACYYRSSQKRVISVRFVSEPQLNIPWLLLGALGPVHLGGGGLGRSPYCHPRDKVRKTLPCT